MIGKHLRGGVRLARVVWVLATAAGDYFFSVRRRGQPAGLPAQADWMCRHSRRLLAALHVRVTYAGAPPAGGLLAANHLSYLDILVLGARQPMVFLSKSEVRDWPLLGWLTACAGTLYIRREKKAEVARFDGAFAEVIHAGLVLGIFPEGTTTDGIRVWPFHSSLFAPAVAGQWRVTPAWIAYEVPGGSARDEVCYWGDMTFFPHVLHLVTLKRITATVAYGDTTAAGPDRKEIARYLHGQVLALAKGHGAP